MSIRIALLAAASLAALAQPALAEQNISKRSAVAADVLVDIENVQGSVNVTAWDRNEVELAALLESDKDTLEYEATERQVRIKVSRPKHNYRYHDDDEEDATLTLRVPKGARLSVGTVSADILVSGVRGEQRLGTVSGTLETQAFDQAVSARSVSGDTTVTGNGGGAAVRTESVSGTITVSGVRGSYEGKIVSGEIQASVAAASRLRVDSVSGDIDIGADLAADARVDMESISGTINLRLKPPVNAEFEVQSFSGDIESCFGGKARSTSKYGPGSELLMTQGNGSARVHIQTLSGEISICDR